MSELASAAFILIVRPLARRYPAASRRANPIGATMSTTTRTSQPPPRRRARRRSAAACITFIASLIMAMVPLLGLTTTAARACACGCSVFDVGGGMLPQENDHGGRIFLEYWNLNQNVNWAGNVAGQSQSQSGQEAGQHLGQRRLQLHVQPAMGNDGARTLGRSRFHHHDRSGGRHCSRPSIPSRSATSRWWACTPASSRTCPPASPSA